ncbi:MAG: hypothetical protein K2M97_00230 [Muribaculaceae bacterium]|nr:hypothetical protein [Muribaculaceae bacterium]
MDLTSVLVTATVFYGIYKIIELFVRRGERMKLIDKITELPADRVADLNILRSTELPAVDSVEGSSRFLTLRWGSFAMGVGLGLILSVMPFFQYDDWRDRTATQSGCVLLFGGLALLVAFVVEYFVRKKSETPK